ncbi:MAG: hypothetical protein AB7S69_05835 [Salinivirgaceae bacterium]|jgi:hypothetical protein
MTKKVVSLISFVLHPVFMTLVGVLIILSFSHLALLPSESRIAIIKIVALTNVIFPLALLPLFYYHKLITGITISDRNERLLPIFITAGFYYFGYYLLHKYMVPVFLQQYLLAAFICVLIAALIHLKWKISLHTMGIGGVIGLLSVLGYRYQIQLDGLLMLAILIAGLIASARLYLREHTHSQVYAGFLLGFLVTFSLMVYIN